MGLNTDPATDASHTSIDYHWYCVNDGTLRARVNSSNAPGTPSPAYAAGDILSVVYDNDTVTWLQNGIVRLQLTAARNLKFHLDSSFYDTGTDLTKFFDFAPSGAAALSYTVVCTNENHTFPAASDGSISSYTGSGTTFEAYRGATRLQGITSGTPTRGQFKVTAGTDTNITKSSTNGGAVGNDIVFGQHGSFTGTTGSIEYSINLENEVTTTKKQTFTKASDGTNGQDGQPGQSITGPDGAIGQRSVQAYIYYQSSSASAPVVPALSKFTPSFSNGTVASSDTNWSTVAPTFTAGNSNKYWYFNFTAIESGTWNGSVWSGVTKASAPSAGSSSVQGVGFTGLVTFTGAGTQAISDGTNQLSFGSQGTTTIDGGKITTGTINANRISLTASDVGALDDATTAAQIGGQTAAGTTTQISQQAVTIVDKYAQITATGLNVYLKTQTYTDAEAQAASLQQIQQLAVLESTKYSQVTAGGLNVYEKTQTYTDTEADAASLQQIQQLAVLESTKYSQITASGLGVYETTETLSTTQAQQTFRTQGQVDAAISAGTNTFLNQAQTDNLISQQALAAGTTAAQIGGQTASGTSTQISQQALPAGTTAAQIGGQTSAGTSTQIQQQAITNTGTSQVGAGKIVLTSGNLSFTDSTQTANYVVANAITLDTTAGANAISIYDANAQQQPVLRVKLGKL